MLDDNATVRIKLIYFDRTFKYKLPKSTREAEQR